VLSELRGSWALKRLRRAWWEEHLAHTFTHLPMPYLRAVITSPTAGLFAGLLNSRPRRDRSCPSLRGHLPTNLSSAAQQIFHPNYRPNTLYRYFSTRFHRIFDPLPQKMQLQAHPLGPECICRHRVELRVTKCNIFCECN
jgi:hypothetical protein